MSSTDCRKSRYQSSLDVVSCVVISFHCLSRCSTSDVSCADAHWGEARRTPLLSTRSYKQQVCQVPLGGRSIVKLIRPFPYAAVDVLRTNRTAKARRKF